MIPKQFQILGHTITVEYDQRMANTHDWAGMANYSADRITLQPVTGSVPYSTEFVEAAFWHEVTHFVLYYGGGVINNMIGNGKSIHSNEDVVDLIGNLLYQVIKTMEYSESGT